MIAASKQGDLAAVQLLLKDPAASTAINAIDEVVPLVLRMSGGYADASGGQRLTTVLWAVVARDACIADGADRAVVGGNPRPRRHR